MAVETIFISVGQGIPYLGHDILMAIEAISVHNFCSMITDMNAVRGMTDYHIKSVSASGKGFIKGTAYIVVGYMTVATGTILPMG
jgi:hypothetical protein